MTRFAITRIIKGVFAFEGKSFRAGNWFTSARSEIYLMPGADVAELADALDSKFHFCHFSGSLALA